MYERMLKKQVIPTFEEMIAYCGDTAILFTTLNEWISKTYTTQQEIVFPYGNQYGWGIAHRQKKKLVCNIFAEDNAFTVMVKLSSKQFAYVYHDVEEYTKEYIDNKYPCSDGGWIHYRVCNEQHIDDIKKLLTAKYSKVSNT